MTERIGRKEPRINTAAAFPDGYYEATLEDINTLELKLRAYLLTLLSYEERVYDDEAVAFHDGTANLRSEPVMLRKWKGNFEGPIGIGAPTAQFDHEGITIILRGSGEVQKCVHAIIGGNDPDSDSTPELTKYTFGRRSEGTVVWKV